jgi:hypothetical protein
VVGARSAAGIVGLMSAPVGSGPFLIGAPGLLPGQPKKQAPDTRQGEPGELLERDILEQVYPIPYVTQPVARFLRTMYDFACWWSEPNQQYLSFWLAVVLLAATVISWVRHHGYYTRRVGVPFALAPAPAAYAPRPVARDGEKPVALESVKE